MNLIPKPGRSQAQAPGLYRPRVGDICLTAVVLLAALLPLWLQARGQTQPDSRVVVWVDNQISQTRDLNQPGRIILPQMVIEVRDRQVKVVRSSCPHHLCQHGAAIHAPGQMLVCVPQRMLVEIQGERRPEVADAITR
jgi:hypothetical protein